MASVSNQLHTNECNVLCISLSSQWRIFCALSSMRIDDSIHAGAINICSGFVFRLELKNKSQQHFTFVLRLFPFALLNPITKQPIINHTQ